MRLEIKQFAVDGELDPKGFHNYNHQDWVMTDRPLSDILGLLLVYSANIRHQLGI
jgi:hypothetical protein